MLKKRGIPCCRALPLGLLLCLLMGIGPVFGQGINPDSMEALLAERFFPHRVNDDFRLSVWGGICFNSERSSENCHLLQADFRMMLFKAPNTGVRGFQSGLFHPLMGDLAPGGVGAGLGGNAMYGFDDTWPDPTPPPEPDDDRNIPTHSAKTGQGPAIAQTEQLKANHNGTMTTTAELMLVFPFQPRFLIEPFIGVGVANISEGTPSSSNHAIEKKTLPVVSYGVGLTVRLGALSDMGPLDLRFQFRGTVYRAGELTYIPLEGDPFSVDVGTISTSSLWIGMGYRFPK